jgi:hypothetical protein
MKTYTGFFGRVPMMQCSLANRVQWDSHLSTGDTAIDAQIDAQDQGIFRLIEEIGELYTRRDGGPYRQHRQCFGRRALAQDRIEPMAASKLKEGA